MDLSFIIVSNNHFEYVKKLLHSFSIIKTDFKFEIILIDNRSNDGLVEFVNKNYRNIKLFAEQKKRGFSANNNIGINASKGKYIFLLNPDTYLIQENMIELAVNYMENHPNVGVLAPKLLNPDQSFQFSIRRYPTLKSTLYRRTPLKKIIKNSSANNTFLMKDVNHNSETEIDWALGAAIILRRECIKDLGGLDERYYLYCEDIDFCFNAKKKGWKVMFYPGICIIHHLQQHTSKKFVSQKTLWHYQSMLHFFIKNKLKFKKERNYIELTLGDKDWLKKKGRKLSQISMETTI